jgi:AcrR family transcriptional regulator
MPGRKRVSSGTEKRLGPTKRGPKAQRGEVSEQILAAARTSFAQNGYAGTTMRSAAAAAGVDPALVTYYFGDKPGLLAAVLQPPATMIDAVAAAAAAPIRKRGEALVTTLLAQWESPVSGEILRSIILTAAHEPVAMDRLRQVFAVSILAAVSANLDDEAERGLRTGLAASQMIGVVMARYVWRVGALAEVTPDEVVRYVAPTIQRYLSGRL